MGLGRHNEAGSTAVKAAGCSSLDRCAGVRGAVSAADTAASGELFSLLLDTPLLRWPLLQRAESTEGDFADQPSPFSTASTEAALQEAKQPCRRRLLALCRPLPCLPCTKERCANVF